MEKKKTDVKMIVGCTILLVVFAVVAVFFWTTVGKEAQKVKEEEAKAEETAISAIYPVSYTHLDVYKRQVQSSTSSDVRFIVWLYAFVEMW